MAPSLSPSETCVSVVLRRRWLCVCVCQVVRLLSRMMSQRSEVGLGQQCQCSCEVKVPPHSTRVFVSLLISLSPVPVSDGPDRGPAPPPPVVGPVGSSTAHEHPRWGVLLWPGGLWPVCSRPSDGACLSPAGAPWWLRPSAALLREAVLLLHWLLLHQRSFSDSCRPLLHLYDQVVPAVQDVLRRVPGRSESEGEHVHTRPLPQRRTLTGDVGLSLSQTRPWRRSAARRGTTPTTPTVILSPDWLPPVMAPGTLEQLRCESGGGLRAQVMPMLTCSPFTFFLCSSPVNQSSGESVKTDAAQTGPTSDLHQLLWTLENQSSERP